MRRSLFVVLLALACDGGSSPAEKTERSNESPTRSAKPEPAPNVEPSGKADPTVPALELPKVDADVLSEIPQRGVEVWIGKHGVWVGGDVETLTKVIPIEGGKISGDSSEILEPLAEALHTLPELPPDTIVYVRRGLRRRGIVLHADVATDIATLRRVVTTARAVGFQGVSFVAVDAKGAEHRQGFNFRGVAPVNSEGESVEGPLRLDLRANGSVMLRHQPMSPFEAAQEIKSRGGAIDGACVVVEPEASTSLAMWMKTAGWLAKADVECLMMRSVAVPSDLPAPPPPPPPPAFEDESAGEEVTPPPGPTPPTPPVPDASVARVAHWWAKASAAADVRSKKDCARTLEQLRDMLAGMQKDTKHRGSTMTRLASQEEECGEAARGETLRLQRTEDYPDDASAWMSLGMHVFGPLWPDPSSGKPYNDKLDPKARHARATRAIAVFEKALSLSPKDERGPHTFAAMAYMQRAWARPGGGDLERPDLEARVDLMKAWEHQSAQCDPARGMPCPEAPSTPEAYAKDVAALAKRSRP